LRESDASPPAFTDVGLSVDLARALERNGELVFLSSTIAYPADVWADIEKRVVGFVLDNESGTVAQIRDAVGTTRKYAVPLLEKLDATGVTRRKGDVRELGPRGRELAGR
jgi:selenocysteine-specific elongation factor